MVREWRHRLQKTFLSANKVVAEEVSVIAATIAGCDWLPIFLTLPFSLSSPLSSFSSHSRYFCVLYSFSYTSTSPSPSQKFFVLKRTCPNEFFLMMQDMPGMDALFTEIENFEGMTVDYLSVSQVTCFLFFFFFFARRSCGQRERERATVYMFRGMWGPSLGPFGESRIVVGSFPCVVCGGSVSFRFCFCFFLFPF
jgi:hypothetical protein